MDWIPGCYRPTGYEICTDTDLYRLHDVMIHDTRHTTHDTHISQTLDHVELHLSLSCPVLSLSSWPVGAAHRRILSQLDTHRICNNMYPYLRTGGKDGGKTLRRGMSHELHSADDDCPVCRLESFAAAAAAAAAGVPLGCRDRSIHGNKNIRTTLGIVMDT